MENRLSDGNIDIIDFEYLQEIFGDENELMFETLRETVLFIENEFTKLKLCFRDEDIVDISHKIKGTAAQMGLFKISKTAENIQKSGLTKKKLEILRNNIEEAKKILISF